MRAKEFNESAVDELKQRLDGLTDKDEITLNDLVRKISFKHRMQPDRLHSLFAKKYKHDPSHWIRKYKGELGEDSVVESDEEQIKKFVNWTIKRLNIQEPYPHIELSHDTEKAREGHHTGVHSGNNIWVYVGNRNLIDIFRTIFHELVHHRQMQLNMIKDGDSYPGSPIEAMADMLAGKYIKIYGKNHPEIFQ